MEPPREDHHGLDVERFKQVPNTGKRSVLVHLSARISELAVLYDHRREVQPVIRNKKVKIEYAVGISGIAWTGGRQGDLEETAIIGARGQRCALEPNISSLRVEVVA